MRRRGKQIETPEQLLAAGEAAARLELERGEDAAEERWRQLDAAELERRVEERRAEITEEAACAAQSGLDASREADAATAEAVRLAAQASEFESALAQCEQVRRQRLAGIEQLTAAGAIERAIALEDGLVDLDPEPVRAKLAEIVAREQAVRDRAAEAHARAEQCAAEAADLRRALGEVEAEIAPEFEQRARKRALARTHRLFCFDQRFLAAAVASRASAAAVLAEEAAKADSANRLLPDGPTVEVGRDGRLLGVAGLIKR